MQVKHLSLQQILYLHEQSLKEFGGQSGIRDKGLVEAAIARPMQSVFGSDAYGDVFEKAGALLHSLAKNHAFLDGNKRTAFISAYMFLRVNGYLLTATNNEATSFMLSVASGKVKEVKEIAAWLKSNSRKT